MEENVSKGCFSERNVIPVRPCGTWNAASTGWPVSGQGSEAWGKAVGIPADLLNLWQRHKRKTKTTWSLKWHSLCCGGDGFDTVYSRTVNWTRGNYGCYPKHQQQIQLQGNPVVLTPRSRGYRHCRTLEQMARDTRKSRLASTHLKMQVTSSFGMFPKEFPPRISGFLTQWWSGGSL